MGRKEGGSLFHQMIQVPGLFERSDRAAAVPVSGTTYDDYHQWLHQAADYFKAQGIRRLDQIGKAEIQAYADALRKEGKAASTIHSYLAPVCKAAGVSMADIEKPKRVAAEFVRSGGGGPKDGGRPGELNAMLGLRRHDLMRLHGNDLIAKDGSTYVVVDKSKGGKYQEQKVLPQYVAEVRKYFDGSEELLFKPKEFVYRFDYHGQRRKVAYEALRYYMKRLETEPGYRKELYRELAGQWHAYNKRARDRLEPLSDFGKPYRLRGKNREAARAQGKPVVLDRLAIRAVSIQHLAHWRDGVTVQSYYLDRGEEKA